MGAQDTDVVIVGVAGRAGIFCALVAASSAGIAGRIVMLDKGLAVEERTLPQAGAGPGACLGCEPCRITTGFSGAGAFSDGKLSLSSEVGGDLPDLIGDDAWRRRPSSRWTASTWRSAPTAAWRALGPARRWPAYAARHQGGPQARGLPDTPPGHGEGARRCTLRIEQHLRATRRGAALRHRPARRASWTATPARASCVSDGHRGHLRAARASTRWWPPAAAAPTGWSSMCSRARHSAPAPSTVDIGVRVEVRNEIMEHGERRASTRASSSATPSPFKNKVRTFCQNPGGVRQPGELRQRPRRGQRPLVQGARSRTNTNLAILCSHNFSEPFNQPIAYAQKVGELTNMLGDGHILVQRFGDILDGKRTWDKELAQSNVTPTLARRGGRRHHRRHALPRDDEHPGLHARPWTRWCPASPPPRRCCTRRSSSSTATV